jgi:hypothetical protein
MSDNMEKYTPNFKVVASSPEEATEIGNFFINLMNYMPNEKLLKAARKVNADPMKKVSKMNKYISLL